MSGRLNWSKSNLGRKIRLNGSEFIPTISDAKPNSLLAPRSKDGVLKLTNSDRSHCLTIEMKSRRRAMKSRLLTRIAQLESTLEARMIKRGRDAQVEIFEFQLAEAKLQFGLFYGEAPSNKRQKRKKKSSYKKKTQRVVK